MFGLRKDGSEFAVEIGLTPIQMIKGMGVVASIVDISARKRLEMQLRRTERLAELGTLASGMAHEIGTPMNVILGRAEYLLQRAADEGMKKGLTTIITQVEGITKVMNQLLAFARRRTPERRAVDFGRSWTIAWRCSRNGSPKVASRLKRRLNHQCLLSVPIGTSSSKCSSIL